MNGDTIFALIVISLITGIMFYGLTKMILSETKLGEYLLGFIKSYKKNELEKIMYKKAIQTKKRDKMSDYM